MAIIVDNSLDKLKNNYINQRKDKIVKRRAYKKGGDEHIQILNGLMRYSDRGFPYVCMYNDLVYLFYLEYSFPNSTNDIFRVLKRTLTFKMLSDAIKWDPPCGEGILEQYELDEDFKKVYQIEYLKHRSAFRKVTLTNLYQFLDVFLPINYFSEEEIGALCLFIDTEVIYENKFEQYEYKQFNEETLERVKTEDNTCPSTIKIIKKKEENFENMCILKEKYEKNLQEFVKNIDLKFETSFVEVNLLDNNNSSKIIIPDKKFVKKPMEVLSVNIEYEDKIFIELQNKFRLKLFTLSDSYKKLNKKTSCVTRQEWTNTLNRLLLRKKLTMITKIMFGKPKNYYSIIKK